MMCFFTIFFFENDKQIYFADAPFEFVFTGVVVFDIFNGRRLQQ